MANIVGTFHWIDYLVFSLSLAVATAIGLFYTWRDRNNQTTTNLLLGDRKMGLLPVTLSLAATTVSGGMLMGVPSEVFYNGTMFFYLVLPNIIIFPFVVHFIIPVYHDLQITSAYEYLELRFNKLARVIGCLVFHVNTLLSMALTLYAPALTLNQVMDVELWLSIVVIGLVCTFYTAVGGLKAVMWTDAFQMLVVFAGLITLIVMATVNVGGIYFVFEKSIEDGKLEFDNFNPSPLERHTFWTLVIGGSLLTLSGYISSQSMVQRYISMKRVKGAQSALYIQYPTSVVMIALLVYAGLVLNAKYGDKNPVPCIIDKPDQLIPYMVMDILGGFYGLPGLFVACIFSASLSTVSSGLNALALVFMTDIFKPLYRKFNLSEIEESKATIYSKLVALLYGFFAIGLAFLAQYFGPLIVQVGFSIGGMVGGPLFVLFVVGFFFPCVNSLGALIGLVGSLLFTSWLAIGAVVNRSSPPPGSCQTSLNTTVNQTTASTISEAYTFESTTDMPMLDTRDKTGLEYFYSISYLYYTALALIVGVVIALVVSCATGGTRKRPVDGRLLSPLYHTLASLSNVYQENDLEVNCSKDISSKNKDWILNRSTIENKTNAEINGCRL